MTGNSLIASGRVPKITRPAVVGPPALSFDAATANSERLSNRMATLGARSQGGDHAAKVDGALDRIARELERHLDIAALAAIAGMKERHA